MDSHGSGDAVIPERLKRAIARLEGEGDDVDASLAAEVRALGLDLRQSMQELRLIGAASIGKVEIPRANDELDAIVEMTATATGSILDACETIEATAAELEPEAAAAMTAAVARIYAACGFQDLTGQRVGKIVATLRRIDRRVSAACEVFGLDIDVDASAEKPALNGDARLLNGPSLPEQAMSQSEIDRVLAGRK